MLHAKPGPSLRARAVPVLLLTACATAFAGLAVVAPAIEDEPSVLAYAETSVTALELEQPAREERATARASRTRRLEERAAAQAKAAAEAKAKAEAAAKAAAEARAKAEAAAKAKAQRASSSLSAPAAASRISGRCPVPNATFTDTWGAPRSGGRTHKGTDLMAPYGSPIYAVASGTVRAAHSSAGGISLYLNGDNGETYFYAHNSRNLVTSGRVQAGDLIARVGSTGNAGGTNHLHFEREVGGRSVNPYAFLRRIC